MKKSAILIFIFYSAVLSKGQENKWNTFLKGIPEIQLPIDSTSEILHQKTLINKRNCWDFVLRPLSVLNNYKNAYDEIFDVDTNQLIINKRWRNTDWTVNEPIYIYSPEQNGKLFCIGKFNIASDYIGIIWLLEQKDIVYGVGPMYWLFCYNKNGFLKDYVCLGLKQQFSLFLINSYSDIKFSISEKAETRKTGEKIIYVDNYIEVPEFMLKNNDSTIIAALCENIPKPVNKDYPPLVNREEKKVVYFTEQRKKIDCRLIFNKNEKFEISENKK
ncbi:MAG: hypothetical protein WC223_00720 [Bacteroidales bacterium]|jgi:hypothetical protein